MKIKVSYLLSYDYGMFLVSVKQLYDYVDKIIVAIDINSKTWSGNTFYIPESFFDDVKKFDAKNKIEFYFDVFYLPDLLPIQNETRERNLALSKLGRGWKIQLDVDEYVYEFKTIARYLRRYSFLTFFPKLTPICLKGKLLTLYRELPEGYLYIENNEQFSFITNLDKNSIVRNNNEVSNFYTNINVIHQSWARSDEEIWAKIKNWGHRDDFDTIQYFEFWKGITFSNYSTYKDIHPLLPEIWNRLHFLDSRNINEFVVQYSKNNKQILLEIPVKKILKIAVKKIFKIN